MSDELKRRLYRDYLHNGVDDPRGHLEQRAAYLQHVIQAQFPRDRATRIVDLGCGHGTLLYYAREAGYRHTAGVDVSPAQVAHAHSLGLENVVEGSAIDYLAGLAPESVDLMVSFDVLEHLSRDELPSFTDAVWRVLKPGGRWLIHVPNGISPFCGRVLYGDLTHEQAFTPVSLRRWLQASGFGEVRCFEEAPVVHGLKSAVRWLLWQGLRAVLRFALVVESGSAGEDDIVSQNFLALAEKP